MPAKRIVANASPLIFLCNSDLEGLLPSFFTEAVVLEAVWQEVVSGSQRDWAVLLLPGLAWG